MKKIREELAVALMVPDKICDKRGWFSVPFSSNDILDIGLKWRTTYQLNHSYTEFKGTVRGLNYQEAPYNQSKIVRCVRGRLYSVGVDIDPSSPDFGKWVGYELSSENQYLMYVPSTYAHGFITLEDDTELEYFTDNEYNYNFAKSLNYDELGIDWTVNGQVAVRVDLLSEKNKSAPKLKSLV